MEHHGAVVQRWDCRTHTCTEGHMVRCVITCIQSLIMASTTHGAPCGW